MKLAVFLMLAVSTCGAQILQAPFAGNAQTTTVTPVLHCAKYQHVYHWPGSCGPSACENFVCNSACAPIPPDRCVDDTHEVTEREWQQVISCAGSADGHCIPIEPPIMVPGSNVTTPFPSGGSSGFTSIGWADDSWKPLATCNLDKDGKFVDCKLAEGRTFTELMQNIQNQREVQAEQDAKAFAQYQKIVKMAIDGLGRIGRNAALNPPHSKAKGQGNER